MGTSAAVASVEQCEHACCTGRIEGLKKIARISVNLLLKNE